MKKFNHNFYEKSKSNLVSVYKDVTHIMPFLQITELHLQPLIMSVIWEDRRFFEPRMTIRSFVTAFARIPSHGRVGMSLRFAFRCFCVCACYL